MLLSSLLFFRLFIFANVLVVHVCTYAVLYVLKAAQQRGREICLNIECSDLEFLLNIYLDLVPAFMTRLRKIEQHAYAVRMLSFRRTNNDIT